MKITTLVIMAMLVLIPIASAQDIVSEKSKTSARIYSGEVIYGTPAGTVVVETLIDDARFVGSDVNIKSENTVKYASNEKSFLLFDDPIVQQQYEYKDDGSLEDTVFLKEPKKLSYHVELTAGSYLVELEDGSYKVINPGVNETTEGYIVISKPFGTDAKGQRISDITYTQVKDVLEVNLPKVGDAGNEIAYPIAIDPILEHRYDLKLLMHGNLEPSAFSTTDTRDSSRTFKMPYCNGAAGTCSVNTTQKKYGNASYFIKSGAFINVTDSPDFTFGTNNFSISKYFYAPLSVTDVIIYNHIQDANNYENCWISSSTKVYCEAKRGGSYVFENNPAVSGISTSAWHHIAWIMNGSTGTLYLDGANVGSASRTGSLTDLSFSPTLVGWGTTSYGFTDEMIITNGGLAPTIDELYNAGEFPLYLNASVGGANLGYADDNYTVSLLHFDGAGGSTIIKDQVGNRTWGTYLLTLNTTYSKFGQSGAFSGAGGYTQNTIAPNYNFGVGCWTVDAWIYKDTFTGSGSYYFSDAASTRFVLVWDGSGRYQYVTTNQSGTLSNVIVSSTPLNTGWNHVEYSRDLTTMRIFQNGHLEATVTVPESYTFGSAQNPYIYGMNTAIDEVRVSKGIVRHTADFTPPVTPYELITNSTATANPTGAGTVPATIQFTDGTPSSAWTANTYNWSFGDGGYSSEENPSHVYTTAGIYPVSFTVSNNNMSTTTSTVVQIGAPYVDFICTPLAGTAAMEVTCTDLTTNVSPITSYTFDWGDGQTTTAAPNADNQWVHVYSTYGAFSPNLTEINSIGTGYKYKRDYIITSTIQNQQQTWYSPHQVAFKFVDRNQQVVNGATINATSDQSTLPGGLAGSVDALTNMYGIRSEQAQQMIDNATHMVGTTSDDGRITFTMHSSLRYSINITDSTGHEYTKNLYPSDVNYVITLPNTGAYISPDSTNNTYAAIGNSTLTFTEPNSSFITIGIDYLDITGRTSALQFYTRFVNNDTYISWTNVSVTGTEHILLNKTYENVRGDQWKWGYLATRTV